MPFPAARRVLIICTVAGLCVGCASSRSNGDEVASPSTSAQGWRVKLELLDTDDSYQQVIQERAEWIEGVTFESAQASSEAVAVAFGSGGLFRQGCAADSCYVIAPHPLFVRLHEDSVERTVVASVFKFPSFEELIQDQNQPDAALLRLVHASGTFNAYYAWNPAAVIVAFNALWRSGKDRALKTLQTYLEIGRHEVMGLRRDLVEDPAEKVFPLLMLLFSADLNGINPLLHIGGGSLGLARGPLVVVRGIPYLTNMGVAGTGIEESIGAYWQRVEHAGEWRNAPLSPTDGPFLATKEIEQLYLDANDGHTNQWDWPYLVSFRLQTLRSLGFNRLQASGDAWHACEWIAQDKQFQAIEASYAQTKLVWDESAARFVPD